MALAKLIPRVFDFPEGSPERRRVLDWKNALKRANAGNLAAVIEEVVRPYCAGKKANPPTVGEVNDALDRLSVKGPDNKRGEQEKCVHAGLFVSGGVQRQGG